MVPVVTITTSYQHCPTKLRITSSPPLPSSKTSPIQPFLPLPHPYHQAKPHQSNHSYLFPTPTIKQNLSNPTILTSSPPLPSSKTSPIQPVSPHPYVTYFVNPTPPITPFPIPLKNSSSPISSPSYPGPWRRGPPTLLGARGATTPAARDRTAPTGSHWRPPYTQ